MENKHKRDEHAEKREEAKKRLCELLGYPGNLDIRGVLNDINGITVLTRGGPKVEGIPSEFDGVPVKTKVSSVVLA
jgi:hypothetical protein